MAFSLKASSALLGAPVRASRSRNSVVAVRAMSGQVNPGIKKDVDKVMAPSPGAGCAEKA